MKNRKIRRNVTLSQDIIDWLETSGNVSAKIESMARDIIDKKVAYRDDYDELKNALSACEISKIELVNSYEATVNVQQTLDEILRLVRRKH